ncbi:MAG: PIN domain-containing protein [Pseudomonadota bacterium]
MTVLILVDTNVILYSRDGRYPVKQTRCEAWLKRLAETRSLVISPQVAGEHQRNARLKLGESQAEAARSTRRLLHWCSLGTDARMVAHALDLEARWQLQWWDAMHLSYAIARGCTHFLTEDAQSAPVIEGVRIIDPFMLAPEDILEE